MQVSCVDTANTIFTLNGQTHAVAAGCSVAGLLAALGLQSHKIAVERNEAIVPRSLYTATRLEQGDRLEIVHFIGGG